MRDIVHRAGPARERAPALNRLTATSSTLFREFVPPAGTWRLEASLQCRALSRAGSTSWARFFHRPPTPGCACSWPALRRSLPAASLFAVGFARSDWVTGANIHPPAQPVPFSHRHHAGELGIDCRYCHTSVAEGPRAGLPPTHTCMTCHSQIWTGAPMLAPVRASLAARHIAATGIASRVLPDYVFFRHDIHIAKGVGCVECHGRVDTMALTYRAKPLTMQFCLDCHRDPAPHLRPLDQITNMDWKPDRRPRGARATRC